MPLKSVEEGKNRPRWSLAGRLTIWYAASALFMAVVAMAFLYWGLTRTLDREDNRFLTERIAILRKLLQEKRIDSAELQWEVDWEWRDSRFRFPRTCARVLDSEGRVLVETQGMEAVLPPSVFPRPLAFWEETPQGVEFRSRSGSLFWLVSAEAHPLEQTDRYLVHVALDRTQAGEILRSYHTQLGLVLGASLILSVFLGYRIAHRGIRPVRTIAQAASHIGSSTLNERIDPTRLPTELSNLAVTFNEMLDRLEEAFGRLSRFSADIAHELRTPINNLRGEAEVALSKPRTMEEYRDMLASNLEECVKLSHIIDSLLFMARAENAEATINREPVEVTRELEVVKEFFDTAAAEAGIRLSLDTDRPLRAQLDRTLFQHAVSNLVENSLAHTPNGGYIRLAAREESDCIHLVVSDDGCGINSSHLPRLFDRFYRVDESRSKQSGGAGLGLSIVRTIAQLHGGSAWIESQSGAGTEAHLVLPCSVRR